MNMKKMMALLLALSMLLVLCACTAQDNNEAAGDAPAANGYQVKVVDAFGNPCNEGVIVRFMQNGQQVTMQVVDANGMVTKDLEDGEYTVDLQFTGDDTFHYDQTDLTLNANKKALEITLYNALSEDPRVLFAYSLKTDGNMEHNAYPVSEGGTYVELIPGERNYFLFTPTRGGTYAFSVESAEAVIGYYGAPHFVQQFTMIEPVDNVITESIRDSMIGTGDTGTTVMVLGLDAAETDTGAVLKVERIGDAAWSVEDEPWHVYEATHELVPYVHPADVTLGEFDLTAESSKYTLVLDSEGYYHLDSEDGPLVLVRLGKKSNGSKYLDPFETIIEHSGVTKYFYDADGNFVKKESYTECLMEYVNYDDEATGLYPLTEDLKYIIQQRGDHYGWFNPESGGYIFYDQSNNKIMNINPDIAWLFYCCYIAN